MNFLLPYFRRYLRSTPKKRGIFFYIRKTFLFSCYNFLKNQNFLKAATLTYYSFLAVVPLIAISFAIAQSFHLQEFLEKGLIERFKSQKDLLDQVIPLATQALEKTKGGVLAGIGVLFLFWSATKVIGKVEEGINTIWNISLPSSWKRKIGNIIILLLSLPVFFILSGALKIWIVTSMDPLLFQWYLPFFFHHFLYFCVHILSYLLVFSFFIFVYLFIPRVSVPLKFAIIAGVIVGIVFEIVQELYFSFQAGALRYGAIYGSFAALPLFLIWLQVSWIIFLFGGELSHAMHQVEYNDAPNFVSELSQRSKLSLSLWIFCECAKRFIEERPPLTMTDLCKKEGIPWSLANDLISQLVSCGLLIEGRFKKERLFQINRPLDDFKVSDFIQAMEQRGIRDISFIHDGKFLKRIEGELVHFYEACSISKRNVLVRNL